MANKKINKYSLKNKKAFLSSDTSVIDEVVYLEDDIAEVMHDNSSEDLEGPETVGEFVEEFLEGDSGIEYIEEALGDIREDLEDISDDYGDRGLPGNPEYVEEQDDSDSEGGDYANDGNLAKFMEYIGNMYPSKIPQHDGTSVLGCERAVSFLDRLNSEISRAIRDDTDSVIDITSLESVRMNIMKDVIVLKNHINKLKKKFKEEHKKESSYSPGVPSWVSRDGKEIGYSQLKKEATTPRNMVIAITPFERAISGIMINAHISGGNDMEEVYSYLSKKYDISDREELSIMQVLADSGYHVFKDRGTYSSKGSDEESGNRGVEFLKNYFA